MSVPGAAAPGAPYGALALAHLDCVLGWQDREPFSPSHGCFDRTYWAWKFTDFPGARFQEAAYALAWALTAERPGEPWAGSPRLRERLEAALAFWRAIQRSDGSFDEAYPLERSLAATAFTTFYVGEACLRAEAVLSPSTLASTRATIARAGGWLCANDERHGVLSNHLAVAAAACYLAFRHTGEARFERRSRHFVARIVERQSPEGWYEEYGGADPGYQTHGTFYLARLWQHCRDPQLLDSLRRATRFLQYFVHPDGTVGGEYASRNTEFYFPAGLEMLAPELPEAAAIAAFMRQAVAERRHPGVWAMDAYNLLPMLNNYLFAADATVPLPHAPALPWTGSGRWTFPAAGLVAAAMRDAYVVVGTRKGGVVRVYDTRRRRLVASDAGWWAVLDDGRVASSQSLLPAAPAVGGQELEVSTDFTLVNQRLMRPWLFVGFRLFSLTLGRARPLAYWLKSLLVRVLVRRRRAVAMRLTRRIRLEEAAIAVSDDIVAIGTLRLRSLRRGRRFATIHMGSSRYFQVGELTLPPELEGADEAAELNARRRVSRGWRWEAS